MTRAELLAAWERQASEAERIGAHAPVAAVLRQVLVDCQSDSDTPSLAPERQAAPPVLERHLKGPEVDELLNVPQGFSIDHWRELGGVKVGKYVRFPESVVAERLQRSRRNGH